MLTDVKKHDASHMDTDCMHSQSIPQAQQQQSGDFLRRLQMRVLSSTRSQNKRQQGPSWRGQNVCTNYWVCQRRAMHQKTIHAGHCLYSGERHAQLYTFLMHVQAVMSGERLTPCTKTGFKSGSQSWISLESSKLYLMPH